MARDRGSARDRGVRGRRVGRAGRQRRRKTATATAIATTRSRRPSSRCRRPTARPRASRSTGAPGASSSRAPAPARSSRARWARRRSRSSSGGAASQNPVATGLKVRRGLLYVAGASTGNIAVHDLANPATPVAVFKTGGGFINDLDLDSHGNVFATDSTQSKIFEVTAAQVAARQGTPTAFDVSSAITSDPNAFNLNGIVVRRNRELIVVQSNVGKLFRITFGDRNRGDDRGHHARSAQAATTPRVQEIAIRGGDGNVNGGDGLLVDRGRLLVVRGSTPHNANGAVQAFKLSRHDSRARFESETSDPSLTGPSTIARARNRLLIVNPNFAGAATATQFTVTGLARNAIRHGGGRARPARG